MRCSKLVDVGRRSFPRGGTGATAGAAAAVGAQPARAQTSLALVTYPSNWLATLADLVVDEPLDVACREAGRQQVRGHATQNLPRPDLRVYEVGEAYAEGVDELIYSCPSTVPSV